jgi:hypothetical protein
MDPTPANLFDSYDQDFQHLCDSIKHKLDVDARDQIGGTFVTFYLAAQRALSSYHEQNNAKPH